jgi:Flp pilus assembly protein TadD
MASGETNVKPATKARQAFLLALLAGSTIGLTGCSSGGFPLASMNPFSRSTATTEAGPGAKVANSFVSTSKNVGTASKNAVSKTTSAIAGVFGRTPKEKVEVDPTDPLSLSNIPDKVDPEVFVANGQLWESTGDLTKAMESYTKALEKSPNHGPALTSIARLHFRQGKYPEAVKYFQQAIAANPQDAGLHNDLGLTYSKMGNHSAAAASLNAALAISPGTSRYANNLATVQFEAGDVGAAYQVLAKNNKPAVAHFNMAYLHFKNGQTAEAKTHLTQAVGYEQEAGQDTVVQRAVERSRDMLAQIDANLAPVAQAAPQATIAGGAFFATPDKAPIQQTSQSTPATKPAPAVTNAASPAPLPTSTPVPAPVMTPPAVTAPSTSTGPTAIPGFSMPTSTDAAATKAVERPMPIRPTQAPTESAKQDPNAFTMPK